jgi:hypothetical protein
MDQILSAKTAAGALRAIALALSCAGAPLACHAFGLEPPAHKLEATTVLEHLRILINDPQGKVIETFYSAGVHEAITDTAYAAQGYRKAPEGVLRGVEWNDNPPFTLTVEQMRNAPTCVGIGPIQLPDVWPGCWLQVFTTANRVASPPGDGATFGPEAPFLQRSHFGDMQFLHAMAAHGEPAQRTRENIIAWAQFAYGVSQGKIPLDTVVSSAGAGSASRFFPAAINPRQYGDLTVRQLFTQGLGKTDDAFVRDMAFGSLLHMVEDSFAKGHVQREAPKSRDLVWGRIVEFHSYTHQDHSAHSKADEQDAYERYDVKPYVDEAVRQVVEARGSDWAGMKSVIERVFDIVDPTKTAGPGDAFKYKIVPIRQPDAP